MKILVTGGLGLIGHNVVHRLEKLEHDVVIVDNQTTYGIIPSAELDYLIAERRKKITSSAVYNTDITSDTIEYLCNRYKFDIIIHLASFPRQKVVNANPMQGADTMITGLLNILESAKTHQVQRVIYVSSSMVYGDFTDNVSEDAVCRPQGQYGIMKLAGEHLVKDYARRGCFDCVILRPSAVYGPLDVEDRVISKFMLAAMQDRVLKVNGASETLDFTYVDDVADGVVSAALTPAAANQTFNITKSHSVSLLKAAEMIVRIVGKGSYQLQNKDADFPSRGALNIDRARSVLGYDPKINVEEGFENYYAWLKNSVYWSPPTV